MSSLKIAILTYDCPHRKTLELLLGLLNRGYEKPAFLTLPFKQRKPREVLIQHRPNMFEGPSPTQITQAHGLQMKPFAETTDADGFDYILIGGAGLIDVDHFKTTKVINAHPGLTPLVRGLDSLKWAVYDGEPVGNTLHFVDAGVDSGEIIAQRALPTWVTDDFKLVAERLYRDEMDLMIHFEDSINRPNKLQLLEGPRHMRMPLEVEKNMMERFPDWISKYGR
jgi:phosphoribosylglycinamide formyltransferase-1